MGKVQNVQVYISLDLNWVILLFYFKGFIHVDTKIITQPFNSPLRSHAHAEGYFSKGVFFLSVNPT